MNTLGYLLLVDIKNNCMIKNKRSITCILMFTSSKANIIMHMSIVFTLYAYMAHEIRIAWI